MNRAVVVAAVLVGLAALGGLLRRKIPPVDWERAFERMPDNAPPKWMFRNITAIRENTDRTLELLQRERTGRTEPTDATTE